VSEQASAVHRSANSPCRYRRCFVQAFLPLVEEQSVGDHLVVEREGLEKKDKSELQAIVEALGGSATARARKAELIDQILELSGATARAEAEGADDPAPAGDGSSGSDSTPAATDSADATDDGVSEADASSSSAQADADADADADAGGQGERRAERSGRASASSENHPTGPDGEPLADWEVQMMDEGGQPAAGSGRTRSRRGRGGDAKADKNGSGGDAKGEGGGRNTGDKNAAKGDKNQEKNADKNADRQGGKNGGDGGEAKNGGSGDGDEDVDPNNRRSRRRGRNRGRDDAGNDGVSNEPIEIEGFLDLRDEGYAFLRVNGFLPSRDDAYVSVKQVRQYGLRKGDRVTGLSRAAGRNEKNPALLQLNTVNGRQPDEVGSRPKFDQLTPLFPDQRLVMERPHEALEMTTRVIDLVAPIGKGQRGLIVSPPKAGKTSIMKQIARSIETNNPEVELLVLLLDERPEEVTDMTRHLERGEVVSSTFDRPPEEHTAIAELTLERAKRRVEEGHDVCILVDGITRLARAYNLSAPQTGRVLSGGVDAAALYPPKRFLGAARNLEEGGSLTILATALVETGSKMDEVIFEEFKGTGNMELRLDRRLAEKRIFPAIDIEGSSTRNEELLRDRKEVEASWKLRKVVGGMNDDAGGSSAAGIEMLVDRLQSFKTNADFLAEIAASRV
jgi:transcription termination factor Rho